MEKLEPISQLRSLIWQKVTNHQQLVIFIAWISMCFVTALCLCPLFYGSSLWMSHLRMTLDEAEGLQWLSTLEDGLQVFSYFSTDLQGQATIHSSPTISGNRYTFDLASWCRGNNEARSVMCYRGLGIDLVSSFVTDFGAQVGEFGNSKDPNKLGEQLAHTYLKTISELDDIFVRAKETNSTADLDIEKLKLIHQLKKSHTIGFLMWVVKVVQTCFVLVLVAFKITTDLRTKSIKNKFLVVVFVESIIVFCQLCTFSIIVSEAVFAAILNSRLANFGVHLRPGPAYIVFSIELVLGAVVAYQAIYR